MNMDTKTRLCALLILLFFSLFTLLLACQLVNKPIVAETYQPELPSIVDIQEMLNELEPNNPVKTDGIYGPATRDKWDRVYCNQQAKKYFE